MATGRRTGRSKLLYQLSVADNAMKEGSGVDVGTVFVL